MAIIMSMCMNNQVNLDELVYYVLIENITSFSRVKLRCFLSALLLSVQYADEESDVDSFQTQPRGLPVLQRSFTVSRTLTRQSAYFIRIFSLFLFNVHMKSVHLMSVSRV